MATRQFAVRKNGKRPVRDDGKKQEKHNPGPGDTHKPEWETDQEM